ncbi:MAG: ATP-binding protein [Candidatus Zixiibacteriota bacterium]
MVESTDLLKDRDAKFADRSAMNKQFLALDALSKLAKQYSNKPDFKGLIETLILTLSGQFSVANAFALLFPPGHSFSDPYFYATGRFKKNHLLSTLELSEDHNRYFIKNTFPQRVTDISCTGSAANFGFILTECGTKLAMPLVHDSRLIGILGLGDKVNRKEYSDDEVELLTILINTIIPFIANSFLFMEISNLNIWYLDILNSVKQGVFVFNSHHLLRKVNLAGFNILRTFRPNLQHVDSLNKIPIELVFPDNVFQGWIQRLNEVGSSEHGRLLKNMKVKSGDIERIYNVRAGTIISRAYRDSDLIITLDDITNQKESEQRLFDLEKFAEKGVMASSISHELNNFLALILGGVEMAQLALSKSNTEKATSTLEKLKTTVNKMERFTAGLMDYTRLNTQKQSTSLNAVITDVLAFISGQKKFKGINIVTELDSSIIDFALDSDQLAQLLLNFFNNAADAIHEVNRETGQIVVRTAQEKYRVVFSISDNGVGIPDDVKERLFKAHLTTKPKGHGYGLVTCAKILQNHQAEIDIDSEVGRGTTFTIRFLIERPPDQNSEYCNLQ